MGGWKTWIAIIGFVALAVVDLLNGEIEPAVTKLTAALAALGIGHKIEKSGQ